MKRLSTALALILLTTSPATAGDEAAVEVSNPKPGTPEQVIHQALQAARKNSLDDLLKIVLPEISSNPEAVKSLELYSWKKFQKHHKRFFKDEKGEGPVFVVTHRIDMGKKGLKLFLKKFRIDGRPCPMHLKKYEGKWYLYWIGCIG